MNSSVTVFTYLRDNAKEINLLLALASAFVPFLTSARLILRAIPFKGLTRLEKAATAFSALLLALGIGGFALAVIEAADLANGAKLFFLIYAVSSVGLIPMIPVALNAACAICVWSSRLSQNEKRLWLIAHAVAFALIFIARNGNLSSTLRT